MKNAEKITMFEGQGDSTRPKSPTKLGGRGAGILKNFENKLLVNVEKRISQQSRGGDHRHETASPTFHWA